MSGKLSALIKEQNLFLSSNLEIKKEVFSQFIKRDTLYNSFRQACVLNVCFLWYEVCEYFFGRKLLITTLKFFWEMITENRVNLEVDQHRRIGIKDVISMLKGLRSEAVIKIVQASGVSENAQGVDINNEISNKAQHNISTQYSLNKSSSVNGNTNLPQIRELNEIAALLRSMDIQQRQLSS